MKRIMYVILAMFIASIGFAIQPTYMPTGLSTFDDDYDMMISTNNATGRHEMGDSWVKGDMVVKGDILTLNPEGLRTCREAWVAPPAADSDTLKTGIEISTSVLVNGTSIFMDATYFTPTRCGRTISVSIDIAFASNTASGLFTVYGIDTMGHHKYESIAASGSVVAGNIPFVYISSAVLAISSWLGSDRGSTAGDEVSYANLGKIYLRVGTGVKLGLQNMPLETTALSVVENATFARGSGATLSTTYGTVDFATDPDGNNREVTYRIRGNK